MIAALNAEAKLFEAVVPDSLKSLSVERDLIRKINQCVKTSQQFLEELTAKTERDGLGGSPSAAAPPAPSAALGSVGAAGLTPCASNHALVGLKGALAPKPPALAQGAPAPGASALALTLVPAPATAPTPNGLPASASAAAVAAAAGAAAGLKAPAAAGPAGAAGAAAGVAGAAKAPAGTGAAGTVAAGAGGGNTSGGSKDKTHSTLNSVLKGVASATLLPSSSASAACASPPAKRAWARPKCKAKSKGSKSAAGRRQGGGAVAGGGGGGGAAGGAGGRPGAPSAAKRKRARSKPLRAGRPWLAEGAGPGAGAGAGGGVAAEPALLPLRRVQSAPPLGGRQAPVTAATAAAGDKAKASQSPGEAAARKDHLRQELMSLMTLLKMPIPNKAAGAAAAAVAAAAAAGAGRGAGAAGGGARRTGACPAVGARASGGRVGARAPERPGACRAAAGAGACAGVVTSKERLAKAPAAGTAAGAAAAAGAGAARQAGGVCYACGRWRHAGPPGRDGSPPAGPAHGTDGAPWCGTQGAWPARAAAPPPPLVSTGTQTPSLIQALAEAAASGANASECIQQLLVPLLCDPAACQLSECEVVRRVEAAVADLGSAAATNAATVAAAGQNKPDFQHMYMDFPSAGWGYAQRCPMPFVSSASSYGNDLTAMNALPWGEPMMYHAQLGYGALASASTPAGPDAMTWPRYPVVPVSDVDGVAAAAAAAAASVANPDGSSPLGQPCAPAPAISMLDLSKIKAFIEKELKERIAAMPMEEAGRDTSPNAGCDCEAKEGLELADGACAGARDAKELGLGARDFNALGREYAGLDARGFVAGGGGGKDFMEAARDFGLAAREYLSGRADAAVGAGAGAGAGAGPGAPLLCRSVPSQTSFEEEMKQREKQREQLARQSSFFVADHVDPPPRPEKVASSSSVRVAAPPPPPPRTRAAPAPALAPAPAPASPPGPAAAPDASRRLRAAPAQSPGGRWGADAPRRAPRRGANTLSQGLGHVEEKPQTPCARRRDTRSTERLPPVPAPAPAPAHRAAARALK